MYKVLIPQDIETIGKDFLVAQGYEVVVGSGWDPETIKREIVECDAVLARTAQYPAEVIRAGKKLKIIARYGVGTDNVDLKAAEALGIYVTIAANSNAQSVAEHTLALILACAKGLVFCDQSVRQGNWNMRYHWSGIELRGKTLGVAGFGNIGALVAEKAHFGLSMHILAYDPFPKEEGKPTYVELVGSFAELLSRSDVISLHMPATTANQNLINKETLALMKPRSILINCARGGLVNEEDLYQALAAKRLVAAGMDVFLDEPPRNDNKLFALENFIATPHSAALTGEAGEAMAMSAAQAIHDVLSGGKPKYPVNHPVNSPVV